MLGDGPVTAVLATGGAREPPGCGHGGQPERRELEDLVAHDETDTASSIHNKPVGPCSRLNAGAPADLGDLDVVRLVRLPIDRHYVQLPT